VFVFAPRVCCLEIVFGVPNRERGSVQRM